MLTYAFDLLVKIYEEEGHAPSEIPEKILTHNLFGLEICPRAAQLASFALVCKAREVSRSAFRRLGKGTAFEGRGVRGEGRGVREEGRGVSEGIRPQIMCLQDVVMTPEEVKGFSDATGTTFSQDELAQIHQFRENTSTFGALIQPILDLHGLKALREKLAPRPSSLAPGDLLVANTHRKLRLVLDQAEMLSQRYQVVVANPPYMGIGQMSDVLKEYVRNKYAAGVANLFGTFILRNLQFVLSDGLVGMIALSNWLFLSDYEALRGSVLRGATFHSLIDNGRGVWGSDFDSCTFVIGNTSAAEVSGSFRRLFRREREVQTNAELEKNFFDTKNFPSHFATSGDFESIPGSPIAFWLTQSDYSIFRESSPLSDAVDLKVGLQTGDNDRFLRYWFEILPSAISFDGPNTRRWYPYCKGGEFRRWYGNAIFVIDWMNDGEEIKNFRNDAGKLRSRPQNVSYYFKEGVEWSDVGQSVIGARYRPKNYHFDVVAMSAFETPSSSVSVLDLLSFLNSSLAGRYMNVVAPGMHYNTGYVGKLPFEEHPSMSRGRELAKQARCLATHDWDNFETSWDFRDFPLLRDVESGTRDERRGASEESGICSSPLAPNPLPLSLKGRTLQESWDNWKRYCDSAIRRMQELETENNRLWIDAYGLQDELDPAVHEDEITLARADKRKDVAAFLSYAVGCMMGRYSLDAPGLICANAGDTVEDYERIVAEKRAGLGAEKGASSEGREASEEATGSDSRPSPLTPRPSKFPPDQDAIIPLLDGEWFQDDVVARTREFLRVTFGDNTLEENLRFIEESLGKDLRKYFLTDFYKDHLQTYKKRPIYWLFQSPKKGFGALVYLHRYTKDTVNTLLNDYLRDFLRKLEARIEHLEHVQDTASSAREKTAATKEADKLRKTLKECREWERDVLLPLAQQRLEIDLDDGVKANYPKFGNALAKVAGLTK